MDSFSEGESVYVWGPVTRALQERVLMEEGLNWRVLLKSLPLYKMGKSPLGIERLIQ